MTVMHTDELEGRLVEGLVLVLGGEGAVVEAVDEEALAEEDAATSSQQSKLLQR